MVVCYFTNWAWYRPGIGKYKPDDIDSTLCTHIIYGFAVLNGQTLTIRTHDSWADIDNNFYTRVTDLKQKGIKVSIAIGGWNDSLGDKYSRLVRNPEARRKFIEDVIKFMKKYGFEGNFLNFFFINWQCLQFDCTKQVSISIGNIQYAGKLIAPRENQMRSKDLQHSYVNFMKHSNQKDSSCQQPYRRAKKSSTLVMRFQNCRDTLTGYLS